MTNSPQLSETDLEAEFKKSSHRFGSFVLRTGAPVIYMKNSVEDGLVNGSRGVIVGFAPEGAWGMSPVPSIILVCVALG